MLARVKRHRFCTAGGAGAPRDLRLCGEGLQPHIAAKILLQRAPSASSFPPAPLPGPTTPMSQSRLFFSALISLSVDCHTARSPTPDTVVTGMGIFPAAQVSTVARPRPGRREIVSVVKSAVLNTQDCASPGRVFSDATGSPRISAASADVTSFRSQALPTDVLAAFVAPCEAVGAPVFDAGFEQALRTRSRMSGELVRWDDGFRGFVIIWNV